jgi:predicted PurR-regulated permease PerM
MESGLSRLLKSDKFYRYLILFFVSSTLIYVFFTTLSSILSPFIGGLLFAYTLDRPICFLMQLRLSRVFSAAFLVLFFVFLIIIFIALFAPVLQNEILLFSKTLPQKVENLITRFSPFIEKLEKEYGSFDYHLRDYVLKSFGDLARFSGQILLNMVTNTFALANLLSFLILTPIITFYIAKDWDLFIETSKKLIPTSNKEDIIKLFKKIDTVLASYAKGQLGVCLILIILYSSVLFCFYFPYAFLIGFLSGLLSFVPYLGLIFCFIICSFVSLIHALSLKLYLGLLLAFMSIAFIEGKILIPRFIGHRINLHPVLVLLCVFAFGKWFGIWGIVFSIPLGAIASVLIREFYKNFFVSRNILKLSSL